MNTNETQPPLHRNNEGALHHSVTVTVTFEHYITTHCSGMGAWGHDRLAVRESESTLHTQKLMEHYSITLLRHCEHPEGVVTIKQLQCTKKPCYLPEFPDRNFTPNSTTF